MSTIELYQQYHASERFENLGSDTFHGDKAIAAYPEATSVLDFGCGNGHAVRRMRGEGREWFGLEYSQAAFDKFLHEPWFYVGEPSQFDDRQFDMTYSTEVLEHIPEPEVEETIAQLCRVTARYFFLTISLRPSSDNNRYHCTLRPRSWWEERFCRHGWVVDQKVVRAFQKVTLRSTRKILSRWANLGPNCEAFAKNPPFELFGETQFWFFAFRRAHIPASAPPSPTVSFYRRQLVPRLRRVLGMRSILR
jgi:2-polyprenyl-3-methyl-5-hydroxy-6-metoxy-1,4-benzoquinol methylase